MIRALLILEFAWFYLRELLASNVRVAFDVLTTRHHMEPAFVHVEVSDLSEGQLLLLSNLISMTPGSLSLDVDDDFQKLTVHCMYARDPEGLTRHLETEYKGRVKRVF